MTVQMLLKPSPFENSIKITLSFFVFPLKGDGFKVFLLFKTLSTKRKNTKGDGSEQLLNKNEK